MSPLVSKVLPGFHCICKSGRGPSRWHSDEAQSEIWFKLKTAKITTEVLHTHIVDWSRWNSFSRGECYTGCQDLYVGRPFKDRSVEVGKTLPLVRNITSAYLRLLIGAGMNIDFWNFPLKMVFSIILLIFRAFEVVDVLEEGVRLRLVGKRALKVLEVVVARVIEAWSDGRILMSTCTVQTQTIDI